MKKWKTVQSEVILKTPHFRIKNDRVELPNKKTMEYAYEDTGDSVLVIGCTEEKKLIMVQQYRYTVGDTVLEFPAGLLEKGEDPEKGAKREFDEETHYKSDQLTRLGTFYESYGISKRRVHLYFAKDIQQSEQKLDAGEHAYEDIEVVLIPVVAVKQMILENKIVNAPSCLAYYLAKEKELI